MANTVSTMRSATASRSYGPITERKKVRRGDVARSGHDDERGGDHTDCGAATPARRGDPARREVRGGGHLRSRLDLTESTDGYRVACALHGHPLVETTYASAACQSPGPGTRRPACTYPQAAQDARPDNPSQGMARTATRSGPVGERTAERDVALPHPAPRPGLYPNIVLLQSIAICNKNTVLQIVHQLQYVLRNGHCLLHLKVEHTLATRHVLLPYIDAHCTHTLPTCNGGLICKVHRLRCQWGASVRTKVT